MFILLRVILAKLLIFPAIDREVTCARVVEPEGVDELSCGVPGKDVIDSK